MKEKETEKWLYGSVNYEANLFKGVDEAKRGYELRLFSYRDDVTRRQASDEFWMRLAEYYGFKIDLQRDKA